MGQTRVLASLLVPGFRRFKNERGKRLAEYHDQLLSDHWDASFFAKERAGHRSSPSAKTHCRKVAVPRRRSSGCTERPDSVTLSILKVMAVLSDWRILDSANPLGDDEYYRMYYH
jgi:hypothetical protein